MMDCVDRDFMPPVSKKALDGSISCVPLNENSKCVLVLEAKQAAQFIHFMVAFAAFSGHFGRIFGT